MHGQDWRHEAWRLEGRRETLPAMARAGEARPGGRGWAGKGREGDRVQLDAAFEAVLDAIPEGILVVDAGERLLHANRAACEMLGLDPRPPQRPATLEALMTELAGRVARPEDFLRRWRAQHRPAPASAPEQIELLEPVRRLLERTVRPLLLAGRPAGAVEIYRDLTPERLLHNKLVQTEKMAALGQLVSGIAHELNNPLTSIMGYAQLLLGRRPARHDPRSGDAEKIYQEAERAARLVRNLLLFAREAPAERALVDLNETVERTLALRSYELRVSNIQVSLDLDPALPRTLADAHQLQQVILNLLVNAEQAIQQSGGAGRIHISTRRLGGPGAGRVALEVADDGPGIPAHVVSRVFDPFFTTKPLGVGTGLGLSIAYGIVQEHGGEIYVESQPGRGARFVVELPAADAEALAAAGAGEPAAAWPPQPQRPAAGPAARRILVVEDEPTVAQLVLDVLAEQGHQVEAVLDSFEGLERALAGGYDLIICDLRMPRMDGRAFYEALVREGSPLRHRIFFITGDTLAPRTMEYLEQEGIPYLAKPFLVEELTLAVNRALSGGEAAPLGDRAPRGSR